jgi:dihydroflavonol-4-reductase
MKLFLTGATGFIGQSLVRAIVRRGWQVRALVRDPEGEPARWLRARGVEVARGDVTRGDGLARLMDGCDVLLHNAGVYEFGLDRRSVARMFEVNVRGTDTVLGAAREAGVARCVHVSSTMALGPSGYAPDPPAIADETRVRPDRFLTPYERSKAEAHAVALAHRDRGLPLNILMPNAVVGVNDHSIWGYFLRLHLQHAMVPTSFARDMVVSFVEVEALAEGVCLVVEKATVGEDYVFAGEPMTLPELFRAFDRHPGGMKVRLWLPRGVMRPAMAMLEPIERALGLPAFLSRDTVDASRGHWWYSSAKARRDLGWRHPMPDAMWDGIVRGERALLERRRGFLDRLRQQAVVPD